MLHACTQRVEGPPNGVPCTVFCVMYCTVLYILCASFTVVHPTLPGKELQSECAVLRWDSIRSDLIRISLAKLHLDALRSFHPICNEVTGSLGFRPKKGVPHVLVAGTANVNVCRTPHPKSSSARAQFFLSILRQIRRNARKLLL